MLSDDEDVHAHTRARGRTHARGEREQTTHAEAPTHHTLHRVGGQPEPSLLPSFI